MATLQDIFTEFGAEYKKKYKLSIRQDKVFNHILQCRTEACGTHINICEECGYEQIVNNSCGDRHCPQCQTFKKEEWINARKTELLNIEYFHLVFTIPDKVNTITIQNQEKIYNILFKACSGAIIELCKDKKWMGATPGIMCVLHTWGQNLDFHPHIHCIVTGGGLTEAIRWESCRDKFIIPVRVLSKKFRGKFLYYLKELYEKRELEFYGSNLEYKNPCVFECLLNDLYKINWYTYAKESFNGPMGVIEYLGRYTHRVAISNNRIEKVADGNVTFKWKDYKDNNKVKEMTLTSTEFIRRFMMHVLPTGFMKIRYYGIISNRNKGTKLAICRNIIQTCTNVTFLKVLTKEEILRKITDGKAFICPCCGKKSMKPKGCKSDLSDTA